ncbi:MAG: ROK family protein, partial [Candidatus Margulisbacteria bacterium]|nr:ROK family protein [Candidatus Margulisiibacteriota bacterium]
MYIGLDVGGTKITAGLADDRGEILQRETSKTAPNVVAQISALIQKFSAGQKIAKIGLGLPGQLKNGVALNMPNVPQLNGVDLLAELNKIYPAEYVIENDANAAALAEL